MLRFKQSLHWCFGFVISFNDFGSDPGFGDEFNRGDKKIEVEVPFGGVEFIEFFNKCKVLKALVAEVLSDVSPVFVFDVCIVVFVVRSSSGELNGSFSLSEITHQVPI